MDLFVRLRAVSVENHRYEQGYVHKIVPYIISRKVKAIPLSVSLFLLMSLPFYVHAV